MQLRPGQPRLTVCKPLGKFSEAKARPAPEGRFSPARTTVRRKSGAGHFGDKRERSAPGERLWSYDQAGCKVKKDHGFARLIPAHECRRLLHIPVRGGAVRWRASRCASRTGAVSMEPRNRLLRFNSADGLTTTAFRPPVPGTRDVLRRVDTYRNAAGCFV